MASSPAAAQAHTHDSPDAYCSCGGSPSSSAGAADAPDASADKIVVLIDEQALWSYERHPVARGRTFSIGRRHPVGKFLCTHMFDYGCGGGGGGGGGGSGGSKSAVRSVRCYVFGPLHAQDRLCACSALARCGGGQRPLAARQLCYSVSCVPVSHDHIGSSSKVGAMSCALVDAVATQRASTVVVATNDAAMLAPLQHVMGRGATVHLYTDPACELAFFYTQTIAASVRVNYAPAPPPSPRLTGGVREEHTGCVPSDMLIVHPYTVSDDAGASASADAGTVLRRYDTVDSACWRDTVCVLTNCHVGNSPEANMDAVASIIANWRADIDFRIVLLAEYPGAAYGPTGQQQTHCDLCIEYICATDGGGGDGVAEAEAAAHTRRAGDLYVHLCGLFPSKGPSRPGRAACVRGIDYYNAQLSAFGTPAASGLHVPCRAVAYTHTGTYTESAREREKAAAGTPTSASSHVLSVECTAEPGCTLTYVHHGPACRVYAAHRPTSAPTCDENGVRAAAAAAEAEAAAAEAEAEAAEAAEGEAEAEAAAEEEAEGGGGGSVPSEESASVAAASPPAAAAAATVQEPIEMCTYEDHCWAIRNPRGCTRTHTARDVAHVLGCTTNVERYKTRDCRHYDTPDSHGSACPYVHTGERIWCMRHLAYGAHYTHTCFLPSRRTKRTVRRSSGRAKTAQ